MRFLIKVDFKGSSKSSTIQGNYWTARDNQTTPNRRNATVFLSKDMPAILRRCKEEGVNFKHIAKVIPLHG
ncbi:hypothetical protein HOU78_gp24 [Vibrio phage 1.204.O._10N.222.46.F12]|uniref:Uncharacterized protein n=1 Tax=Vibrio phage 1.204.O._10N.222.46.F12 TaxID=1881263 RepID=A0A2I7RNM5_9CAUD|nr:hypothetical protein HOU78_gp24 [Vibrio phage 1.204.O._10N.222.46.F12]AUR95244.1 hypothetical protein NVP1204O_24 [Vibrio phage 1.204.O._10N.222.46.F12]